jgi:hypothetical protein
MIDVTRRRPQMKKKFVKMYLILAVTTFLICNSAWAGVNINPFPQPPSSAKLRIFIVAVTSSAPKRGWAVSNEAFYGRMITQTSKLLADKGIYEVVPVSDIMAVLGNQKIASWQWMGNNWALAKDVGRVLYADYVLLIERSHKVHFQFDMTMVNIGSGKEFSVSNYVPSIAVFGADEMKQAYQSIVQINYQLVFREAKNDLMQTAIRKGKIWSEQKIVSSEGRQLPAHKKLPVAVAGKTDKEIEKQKVAEPELTAAKKIPSPAPALTGREPATQTREKQISPSSKQREFEKELEKSLQAKDKKQDGARLVVYDFDSVERLRVVGLILTEALREELHNLGGFVLVNRENMLQAMEEYKLQQSGPVDEKQAVKMGKWLAANEAVTGHLAILGSTSVLQAKRYDIKTMSTIALGSLKCKSGAEDELLNNMHELAIKLVQQKQPK